MTIGLKALGAIGTVAALAVGISASESSPKPSVPQSAIAPKTMETTTKNTTSVTSAHSVTKTAPKPTTTQTKPASNCHPSYSGCLKQNAGDYDCASGTGNGPNYTGPVQVHGSDPFDLDRDNDGWGCE